MITQKGTQTIYTKRLMLRRFTVSDAQAMFENWAKDERVTRYLTWCPHTSSDMTKQLLASWCAEYEKNDYYNWAIEWKGIAIGNISVVRQNEALECAELGYCMGYDFWGKGIMSEAVSAVIRYLFSEVGIHRIEIHHDTENPASGRVAQKCGCSFEGVRRDGHKSNKGTFLTTGQIMVQ